MKGFSAHLVIFVVVALFGFGLFFLVIDKKDSEVKGVTDTSDFSRGLSLTLTSRKTSWDVFQYLCNDLETCTESIDSGKRISKLSGDVTELKELIVVPMPFWDGYKFIKVYARPSWDILSPGFNVVSAGDVPGTEVAEIPYGSAKQQVVIIPIEEILNQYYKSATFSD